VGDAGVEANSLVRQPKDLEANQRREGVDSTLKCTMTFQDLSG
jgi:hypothetical protein